MKLKLGFVLVLAHGVKAIAEEEDTLLQPSHVRRTTQSKGKRDGEAEAKLEAPPDVALIESNQKDVQQALDKASTSCQRCTCGQEAWEGAGFNYDPLGCCWDTDISRACHCALSYVPACVHGCVPQWRAGWTEIENSSSVCKPPTPPTPAPTSATTPAPTVVPTAPPTAPPSAAVTPMPALSALDNYDPNVGKNSRFGSLIIGESQRLQSTTEEVCANACNQNDDCQGFTYRSKRRDCTFKRKITLQSKATSVTYVKKKTKSTSMPTTNEPRENYSSYLQGSSNACPARSRHIVTMATCVEAGKDLGLNYNRGHLDDPSMPNGCIASKKHHKEFMFNNVKPGATKGEVVFICGQMQ